MSEVVDLSFPIHEGMTTFPVHWHPMVEISQMGRLGMEQRETRKLVLGTHTGTHCDAPRHFIAEGRTIDQIPIGELVGPAVLVDLVDAGTDEITAEILRGLLPGGVPARLVLRFGWSRRWATPGYYSGHPYLTADAADWLVAGGLSVLGMDTPMPDDPRNGQGTLNDSPIHKILLGRDVTLVEYLNNLDRLPAGDIFLVVLPLNVLGGDGAPARAVAWPLPPE